jgi:hypothetical protein
MAIPGYKGHIPGMKIGDHFGKRFTEHSRDALTQEKLDNNTSVLSTTGYFSKKAFNLQF